jgi:hypothetical protein
MSANFNSHDKDLVKRIYDLTELEVFEAEKLYVRSSFSVCKSAKIIKDRRGKS